jgi:hypothetical protein
LLFSKKGIPENQSGTIVEDNTLSFCPNSKKASVKNQHAQIMIQPFFWQHKKPAVIKIKENAWTNDGKLFPINPNKFGRVL